jgi:hypothetical protein
MNYVTEYWKAPEVMIVEIPKTPEPVPAVGPEPVPEIGPAPNPQDAILVPSPLEAATKEVVELVCLNHILIDEMITRNKLYFVMIREQRDLKIRVTMLMIGIIVLKVFGY